MYRRIPITLGLALLLLHPLDARSQRFSSENNLNARLDAVPDSHVPPFHPTHHDRYTAVAGAGINFATMNEAPITMYGALSYQTGAQVLACAMMQTTNNATRNWWDPFKSWMEFDAMYGYGIRRELSHYALSSDYFNASITSGVGIATRETRYRNNFRRRGQPPDSSSIAFSIAHPNVFEYSVSLPIQAQITFAPYPFVGIGTTLFLNVNKFQTLYGALLTLQIGWL